MEKIIRFDNQGRIYLPEELRKILKFKTLVAKSREGKIILEPIEEDPLDSLSRIGARKLKKPIKKIKEEARKELEDESIKKIC
jgi:bifunctional DNA-binding transcriptional regulator/antitoxin component of YhaV-PrlF toxin-antitoxin module